jgi:hypothetical protein
MKNNFLNIIGVVAFASLFFACNKEKNPGVYFGGGLILDSTYVEPTPQTAQPKRVMMEEFSGQQCWNCTKGHNAVDSILEHFLGKVTVATLHCHGDNTADPYSPENIDFRTTFADQINSSIAQYIGLPSAMVNRVLFAGQSSRAMTMAVNWETLIPNELSKTSPVNITINNTWHASSRQIISRVELHYTANVAADTQSISIMVTENNIVAPQMLTNGTKKADYVHQHILRTMLTPPLGKNITENKTSGRVVVLQYISDPIPSGWNENNLNIVAFVHRSGHAPEVLQVAEKKLQ